MGQRHSQLHMRHTKPLFNGQTACIGKRMASRVLVLNGNVLCRAGASHRTAVMGLPEPVRRGAQSLKRLKQQARHAD